MRSRNDDTIFAALDAVLRLFPGLTPGPGSEQDGGAWQLPFIVAPDVQGWRSLEFLAWAAGDLRRGGASVTVQAFAAAPYLNEPGECLTFALIAVPGGNMSADAVAARLSEWRSDYIPVDAS